ncbi:MarR family winged helix-turn-helix transcriptional regulator [Limobrevibacterium gyesilva]|uniref:MarR family transcriptional regulator n=1 Tax=Limobrevibacterium gyesilva TaxID=2991712 RepID=A0AA41YRW2_9PROT|nr:MarR family transcriptional regulator [Limobrevibacterium gyesilva]MCW3474372.1 MarR family transcriptional regulator [Limobrevibacterium gyesilva]
MELDHEEEPSANLVLDAETRAQERPSDHQDELRLWLRLLTCTTMIEGEIRTRLRERFDVTLPRFDLLAQLEKAPDGMTLGELSRRMMVSNGNITGLVERLAELGLVERVPHPADRRAAFVRLTPAGHSAFAEMASQHADWIAALFDGLSDADIRLLMRLLSRMKQSVRDGIDVRKSQDKGE